MQEVALIGLITAESENFLHHFENHLQLNKASI